MASLYRFARKALFFNTILLFILIVTDLLFFAPDSKSKADGFLTVPPDPSALRWRNILFGTVFGADLILCAAWRISSGRLDAERERRRRLGLCLTCGYDIRASGDYCSECGQFINLDERGRQL